MKDSISRDEWLAELAQLYNQESPTEAMTMTEIAEAAGRSKYWAINRIRKAIKEGYWECIEVTRETIRPGVSQRVPAYRPIVQQQQ